MKRLGVWQYLAIALLVVLAVCGFAFFKEKAQSHSTDSTIFVDNSMQGLLDGNGDCPSAYNPQTRFCGTGNNKAYKEIQSAADVTAPGDTVLVRQGNYRGGYRTTLGTSILGGGLYIKHGGAEGKPVSYKPYNNEDVAITPGENNLEWTKEDDVYVADISKKYNEGTNVVYLIKKDGYGLVVANDRSELTSLPQPIQQRQLDLFFYDQVHKKLYLHTADYSDPGLNYYAVAWNNSVIVGDDAHYVNFSGFKILYAYCTFIVTGSNITISNNTIKHTPDVGILSTGTNVDIKNNYFEYTGKPILEDGGHTNYSDKPSISHSIYISKGNGGDISGNKMLKCQAGQCMHAYNVSAGNNDYPDPKNLNIHNNYIENGMALSGTGNKVYNNVLIGELRVYPNGDNSNNAITNNTIILTNQMGVYLGVSKALSDVIFTNNIVLGAPNAICMAVNKDVATVTPAMFQRLNINNNIYSGCEWFRIGKTDYNNFASYKAAMNQNGKEQNSTDADPKLNQDYIPAKDSPAVDAAACEYFVKDDYLGIARPQDGDGNGSQLCDIGAHEVASTPTNVTSDQRIIAITAGVFCGLLIIGALLFWEYSKKRRK